MSKYNVEGTTKEKDYIYKCPECESTNITVFSISSIIATTYRNGELVKRAADDIYERVGIECDDCKYSISRDDQGGDHLDDEAFRCYKEKKEDREASKECPLTITRCQTNSCPWWHLGTGECSMRFVAKALEELLEHIKSKKKED